MAITRSSNDTTKAALAKLVRPETLDDIEEFLRPEFPPKKHADLMEGTSVAGPGMVMRRRIVMDGHGRWREVKGEEVTRKNLRLLDSRNLSEMTGLFDSKSLRSKTRSLPTAEFSKTFPLENSRYSNFQDNSRVSSTIPGRHGQARRHSENQYNHLGMTTRSNVFPGLGNFQWNSTTAKTFTEKAVTPVKERHKFFGIQTDNFGQWSAANVHHERMKKAWEEYQASAPKPTANRKPPEPRIAPVASQKPPKPQPKPKKIAPKPKPPKPNQIVTTPTDLQERPQDPPSKPPPSVPVDNEGDDFWEFFDKPFNKPR